MQRQLLWGLAGVLLTLLCMGLLSLRYHSSLSPQRVPKTPELSPPSPWPSELQLHDVFIVVKTTQAFHHSRQELQLNTWVSRTQPFIFSDSPDEGLQERLGSHLVGPTTLQSTATLPWGAGFCINYKLALKMPPWASGSHFMDASALIWLPDDSTVGYIVECELGSLETLQLLEAAQLPEQVTLSYGIFEGKLNVINLHGPFSPEEGPSRFHSLHCLLYPDTPWCLQLVA
ncbi:hypothetical protein JEQ12_001123 [Ovis aries]|uniref:Fringe-like glycosyltransferase domain-containing protein n=1 Tax=Ovis aries TaxID=9940 RepID=A0A836APJ2_SHEEP|nr:hypothetical protein JEQ12_001123 [Ovis aries]